MKSDLGFFGKTWTEADERDLNAMAGARRASDQCYFRGGHRRLARRVRADTADRDPPFAEGFA